MHTFDLSPLFRSTVGFDRLASLLDNATRDQGGNYPAYNIEVVGEDAYRITMAIAGFAEADLDITSEQNKLTISGRKEKNEQDERNYLHRGIAERSFERRFQLADHVRVTGAELENGLLHVDLVREVPEAMKPQKIAIGSRLIESEVEKVA